MHAEKKFPNTYLLINDIIPSRTFGLNYYYGYSDGYSYAYYDYNNKSYTDITSDSI